MANVTVAAFEEMEPFPAQPCGFAGHEPTDPVSVRALIRVFMRLQWLQQYFMTSMRS
jgi:hypothetical protein